MRLGNTVRTALEVRAADITRPQASNDGWVNKSNIVLDRSRPEPFLYGVQDREDNRTCRRLFARGRVIVTQSPDERIEYLPLPDMPGAAVLVADRCARRWRVYHETYAVCTLLDLSGGETEWTYRGRLHASKAGGQMLMEPGEVHANPRAVPPCDFRALFVTPVLMETAAADLGMRTSGPHLKSAHSSDPAMFQAFARFHAALERGASLLERESRLTDCIRLLLGQYAECRLPNGIQDSRTALRRVRDLILDHYARPIALNELVAASGLSRYYLVRAFAKEFGLPPHAYQVHVQIAKARLLLASGAAPAYVGVEVGFSDQSHLIRHFKRSLGVTPGLYRRKMAQR